MFECEFCGAEMDEDGYCDCEESLANYEPIVDAEKEYLKASNDLLHLLRGNYGPARKSFERVIDRVKKDEEGDWNE